MKLSRRDFLKGCGKLVAGGGLAFLAAYEYSSQFEAHTPVLEQVQIPIKNLPLGLEGFKIVQLSDIHLYPYTQLAEVQAAVAMANRLAPDVVVLTGDYVLQAADSIFDLAPALASLQAKHGVFAVLGNHDFWTNAEVVRLGFRQAGLSVLHNQGLPLRVGGETLYLAGLDDGWSGRPDLSAALADAPPGAPVVLLVHEPDLADSYSLDGRVSLQLSGHTHGGQVRLPGFGPPFLPHLGQKYDQGLYWVNRMPLYTNRGLGLIAPFRLNCPPEVTEITLVGA